MMVVAEDGDASADSGDGGDDGDGVPPSGHVRYLPPRGCPLLLISVRCQVSEWRGEARQGKGSHGRAREV
ncbi:hypothetical protein E2C01_096990 [Portunus trituberculatus]|uniref:Uncharacterized protein n=1 Tax=Portunus trituberculatus TaxID=210409 RepID=A0A5B7K371_PORTR|nr:hypothetical protein [Portunus trituberculatus]